MTTPTTTCPPWCTECDPLDAEFTAHRGAERFHEIEPGLASDAGVRVGLHEVVALVESAGPRVRVEQLGGPFLGAFDLTASQARALAASLLDLADRAER